MSSLKMTLWSALAVIAMTAAAGAQTIGLGTTPQGSLSYATAAAISKVAKQSAGLRLLLQPHAGTSAQFTLVNVGELEFGIADVTEVGEAVQGRAAFKGHARPNLRVATVLYPLAVGLFVRNDSSIRTLQDLKGKRLPTGWGTFTNGPPLVSAILRTAGMSEADIKPVPTPGLIRAADDFMAGKTDATMFGIGAPKVAQANAAVGGIRYLPIDGSPKALAAIRSVRPGFYLRKFQPSKRFVGIVEPTNLLLFDLVLFVNNKVGDEIVYRVVKGLSENKPTLVKSFPFLRQFSPDRMAKDIPLVEYHPGAIKLYRDKGRWPPPKRS